MIGKQLSEINARIKSCFTIQDKLAYLERALEQKKISQLEYHVLKKDILKEKTEEQFHSDITEYVSKALKAKNIIRTEDAKRIARITVAAILLLFGIFFFIQGPEYTGFATFDASNFTFVRQICINNTQTETWSENFTAYIVLNTTERSRFRADGNDVVITNNKSGSNIEVDRYLVQNNTAYTLVFWKTNRSIASGVQDCNYNLFYNNSNYASPKANGSNVFLWFDDFEQYPGNANISVYNSEYYNLCRPGFGSTNCRWNVTNSGYRGKGVYFETASNWDKLLHNNTKYSTDGNYSFGGVFLDGGVGNHVMIVTRSVAGDQSIDACAAYTAQWASESGGSLFWTGTNCARELSLNNIGNGPSAGVWYFAQLAVDTKNMSFVSWNTPSTGAILQNRSYTFSATHTAAPWSTGFQTPFGNSKMDELWIREYHNPKGDLQAFNDVNYTITAESAACTDFDGDGFNASGSCGILDCNDNNAAITPPGTSKYINQPTTFCPGYYDVNAVNINVSNAVVSCNQTIMNGTGAVSGFNIRSNNVTIQYCSFVNYNNAILGSVAVQNSTFKHNYIRNATNGIELTISTSSYNTFINNTIINTTSRAIGMSGIGGNTLINNTIVGYAAGFVDAASASNGDLAYGNSFSGLNSYAILFAGATSHNVSAYNNSFFSVQYAVYAPVSGNNVYIAHNNVQNSQESLEICGSVKNNITIAGNYVVNVSSGIDVGCSGTANSTVVDNRVINSTVRGIGFGGSGSIQNHYVRNNTVRCISGSGMETTGSTYINATFIDNRIYNCTYGLYSNSGGLANSTVVNNTLENNTYAVYFNTATSQGNTFDSNILNGNGVDFFSIIVVYNSFVKREGASVVTLPNIVLNSSSSTGSAVYINRSIIAVNVSLEPSLNKSSNVTLEIPGNCNVKIRYYPFFTRDVTTAFNNGVSCTPFTTPACTDVRCSNGIVSFNVPHFDTYTAFGNNYSSIESVFINSTFATNYSDENITAYWTSSDPDGDSLLNITDWRINGTSYAAVNLPFENNLLSINTTKDYSSYNRTFTVANATWTTRGKIGGAYIFDGATTVINSSDSRGWPIGNITYTYEAWINTSYCQNAGLIDMGNDAVNQANTLRMVDDCRLINYWFGNDLSDAGEFGTHLNRWTYLVARFNGTHRTIWIDGVITAIDAPGMGRDTQGTRLRIGFNGNGFFNGTIDEVRIYNYSLSDKQILLHNASRYSTISDGETRYGQTWSLAMTANDFYDDSNTTFSNNIFIKNAIDIISIYPNQSNEFQNITTETTTVVDRVPSSSNLTFNVTAKAEDYEPLTFSWFVNQVLEFVQTITSGFTGIFSRFFGTGTYNVTLVVNGSDATNTDSFSFVLNVNCTAPSQNLVINSPTRFCSGTYNLASGIIVNVSNAEVQCNQTIFNGTGTGTGTHVRNVTNTVISGCTYLNYVYGVHVNQSTFINVTSSDFVSNSNGVTGFYSESTTISNSNFTENAYSITYENSYATPHHVIYNNTIRSTTLNYGAIALWTACDVYVKKNYISINAHMGSAFGCTSSSLFEDNHINFNGFLTGVEGGTNVTARNNFINGTQATQVFRPYSGTYYLINNTIIAYVAFGVDRGATYSIIENNTIISTTAISLHSSSSSLRIYNNLINASGYGISMGGGSSNIVENNKIIGLATYGIYLGRDGYFPSPPNASFRFPSTNNTLRNNTIVVNGSSIYADSTDMGTSYAFVVNSTFKIINQSLVLDFGMPVFNITYNVSFNNHSFIYRQGYVAVDVTVHPGLNVSTNISMPVGSCSAIPVETAQFYKTRQEAIAAGPVSCATCSNQVCVNNIFNLTKSQWGSLLFNTAPNISSIIVNSTFGFNRTTENLSVTTNAYDFDNDSIINITDWRVNDVSMAILNMPFDGGSNTSWTRDYSTFAAHGNVSGSGISWISTGGYDGFGTYNFTGGGSIHTNRSFSTGTGNKSFYVRFKQPALSRGWQISGGHTCSDGASFGLFVENSGGGLNFFGCSTSDFKITTISPNTWYQVVVTYDGTTVRAYVDGILNASAARTLSTTQNGIAIGHRIDSAVGDADDFEGLIDYVLVFNRTLSAEQVLILNGSFSSLSSYETFVGNNWSVAVTPNDRMNDGATYLSNTINIRNVINITQIYPNQTGNVQNITYETSVNITIPISGTTNTTFNVTATPVDTEPLTFRWFVNGVLEFIETIISGFTSTFSRLFTTPGQYNVTAVVNGSDAAINSSFTFAVNATAALNIGNVTINASTTRNSSADNLFIRTTVYGQDEQAVIWKLENRSIFTLYAPIESFDRNASLSGGLALNTTNSPVFEASGGVNGGGAYRLQHTGSLATTPHIVLKQERNYSQTVEMTVGLFANITHNTGDVYFFAGDGTNLQFAFINASKLLRCASATAGNFLSTSVSYNLSDHLNEYHSYVCTTGTFVRIFIDGKLNASSVAMDEVNFSTNTAQMRVGAYGSSNNGMNGSVDNIFISNRVWTPSLVELWHNGSRAKTGITTLPFTETRVADNWSATLFVWNSTNAVNSSSNTIEINKTETCEPAGSGMLFRKPTIVCPGFYNVEAGIGLYGRNSYLYGTNVTLNGTTRATSHGFITSADYSTIENFTFDNFNVEVQLHAAVGNNVSGLTLYHRTPVSGSVANSYVISSGSENSFSSGTIHCLATFDIGGCIQYVASSNVVRNSLINATSSSNTNIFFTQGTAIRGNNWINNTIRSVSGTIFAKSNQAPSSELFENNTILYANGHLMSPLYNSTFRNNTINYSSGATSQFFAGHVSTIRDNYFSGDMDMIVFRYNNTFENNVYDERGARNHVFRFMQILGGGDQEINNILRNERLINYSVGYIFIGGNATNNSFVNITFAGTNVTRDFNSTTNLSYNSLVVYSVPNATQQYVNFTGILNIYNVSHNIFLNDSLAYVNSSVEINTPNLSARVFLHSGDVRCSNVQIYRTPALWKSKQEARQDSLAANCIGVSCFVVNCTGPDYDVNITFNVTGWSTYFLADNLGPRVDSAYLNATAASNYTTQNLTLYLNTSDADGGVINLTDWRNNGVSIAVLNAYFENTSTFRLGPLFNVTDYSTYGRNGTVSSATLNMTGGVTGGAAYQFDGSTDFVTFPKEGLIITNKTINFFVKFTSTAQMGIAGQHACGFAGGWFFIHAYAGQPAGVISFYDVARNSAIAGGSSVNDGAWRMITGKLNGTHQILYIDGVPVVSDTYAGVTTDAGNPITLGGVQPSPCGFGVGEFQGQIDSFSMYNYSISDEQILLWNTTLRESNTRIHSKETRVGQIWSACVTPNDRVQDGTTVCSNNVTIKNILNITQIYPNQTSELMNVTPDVTNVTIFRNVSSTNTTFNVSISVEDTEPITVRWFVNQVLEFTQTLISGFTSMFNRLFNIAGLYNVTAVVNGSDAADNRTFTFNVNVSYPYASTTNVSINSTYATNYTDENLTAYWSSSSPFGPVINITDWRVNGNSIAVLNMPFENTSSFGLGANTNVTDYSTTGNNGTIISGVSFNATAGYDGRGAYNFAGTVNGISVNPSKLPLGASNRTISVWFNPNSSISRTILGYGSNANGQLFELSSHATGNFIWHGYGGGYDTLSISAPYSANTWNHGVVTYNGTDIEIYLNGVYRGSYTIAINTGSTYAIIGGQAYIGPFDGFIDDVRIYNRSLSAEQIALLYQNKSHIISSQETIKGQVWSVAVTANDGNQDGQTVISNNVTIRNKLANTTDVSLNSTFATNYTDENLTLHWSSTDADNDRITNITDWRTNGASIALFNMPFENHSNAANNATDYSTFNRTGSVLSGALFNASGGHAGGGAYQFDNDGASYVRVGSLGTFPQNGSIRFRMKPTALYDWQNPFSTNHHNGNDALRFEIDGGGQFAAVFAYDGNPSGTIGFYPSVSAGNWYDVVLTWNKTGSLQTITGYLNGVQAFSQSQRTSLTLLPDVTIGTGFSVSRGFTGFMDDVTLYNRTLSAAEVISLNASQYSTIPHAHTIKGQIWSACVTPNDGVQDGTTICSNNVTIRNKAPTTPTPTTPNNGNNTLINLNVTFNWTAATDADGDSLTYFINLTSQFCSNQYYGPVSGVGFISTELQTTDLCGAYFWAVRAYDGTDYSNYSASFNFSIQPYIEITLLQNLSDFGNMQILQQNDTVDNNPLPFLVRSDSNVFVNINLRALDELWNTSGLGNTSFMFKSANSSELGSYNISASQEFFIPVKLTNQFTIHRLSFYNSTDTAEIELNVTVPDAEPPGQKSSILVVEGSQS